MELLDRVKEALAPALEEVLKISEESFKELTDDVVKVLGGDARRPRKTIKETVEKLIKLRIAAEKHILAGNTEKGERILKSIGGTLNSYQVIAANKTINEAYLAWRKILTVLTATLKELGPVVLGAVAGPTAGAVAKVASGATKDDKAKDDKAHLENIVAGASKKVTEAAENLAAAEKSEDKKAISTARGALTRAKKEHDTASKALVNAA